MTIFPKEVIESTSEYYLSKIKVRSQIIYSLLLVMFIGIIIALPFIVIDLSISARGILAPRSNRVVLYAPATGPVIYNSIDENSKLNENDTICIIDTQLLDTQIEFNRGNQKKAERNLADLKILLKMNFAYPDQIAELSTAIYYSSANELIKRLKQLNMRISKSQRDYIRDKKLFDSKVISPKEFEATTFEYNLDRSNYELALQQKLAQWEMDVFKYKNEVDDASAKIEQLEEERERYFLIAPISGVVQQYSGIREGSFVYANQKIAELSSDFSLIAEMYVSPSDIGFIEKSKPVKIQVDAFNYNQWGMLEGKIVEISDDVVLVNQIPFFKVKCSFSESYLTLNNGYKGYLKKGMTIGGRILINRRSLYQLLYDKVDDWLNPSKA